MIEETTTLGELRDLFDRGDFRLTLTGHGGSWSATVSACDDTLWGCDKGATVADAIRAAFAALSPVGALGWK